MSRLPSGKYVSHSLGVADLNLGDAGGGTVARWIVHVTAVSGTVTPKGAVAGTGTAPVGITAVKRADGSTVTSITATGVYDIDAAGLDVTLSSGTSVTFDAIPVYG